jgi:hypothetical protein
MYVAKRGRSWLEVDRWGHRSSKGVDCDILTQSLIELIRKLIPSSYAFFFESPISKNFRVKRAWLKAI